MGYKSSVLLFEIFLVIIFLFLILNSSACAEEMANLENKQDDSQILSDYIAKIYQQYARENFQYVYQELHPGIKKVITEDQYWTFQEKNFRKYKLKITEIKVVKEVEQISLPADFTDLITVSADKRVYKVQVSYKMKLVALGKKQTRNVKKGVLVFKGKNRLYLLWNPSIMDKHTDIDDGEAENK